MFTSDKGKVQVLKRKKYNIKQWNAPRIKRQFNNMCKLKG